MTFDELFAEHSLTAAERAALVAHLASMRATATVQALIGTATSELARCVNVIEDLHGSQTLNNQEYPRAWHEGLDAAVAAILGA